MDGIVTADTTCPVCGEHVPRLSMGGHVRNRGCQIPRAWFRNLKRIRDNERRYRLGIRRPSELRWAWRPERSLEDRFWEKVDRAGLFDCWQWLGTRGSTGYGQLRDREQRIVKAHRIAYELVIGPIPDGLFLDHLCRNRACVNPAHLEPVTTRENNLRAMRPQAAIADVAP